MEPVDYAPYIGRNHGNAQVYVSTGDSGEGLTTGVVAGMLLRDLILGRDNAWAQTYAPQRVTLRAAGEYIRENATMVAQGMIARSPVLGDAVRKGKLRVIAAHYGLADGRVEFLGG
jgi:hypothetical protein